MIVLMIKKYVNFPKDKNEVLRIIFCKPLNMLLLLFLSVIDLSVLPLPAAQN